MTPKRLIPFLAVFVALAAAYFASQWHQERQESRAQESKKLFPVKEDDINQVVLIKGREEIRLAKIDKNWQIMSPLKTRADKVTMDSLVSTLALLKRDREVGEPKDLGPFGLSAPPLVVEFTAQGQSRRLAVGAKTPGDQAYYVQADRNPQIATISSADKETLDRNLAALRDKNVFDFTPEMVQGLHLGLGAQKTELVKTGPGAWRWPGREQVKLRGDRLEALVRQLTLARFTEIVQDNPKNVKPYGLAPKPEAVITVLLDKGTQNLTLGALKGQKELYARRDAGPVALLDQGVLKQVKQTLAGLEDRRLWAGDLLEVSRVAWGKPTEKWTAVKEKNTWKVNGPEKREFSWPASRLEMVLWQLKELEYERLLSNPPPPPQDAFAMELQDGAGRVLARLEEAGPQEKGRVAVRITSGDKSDTALLSYKVFRQWQEDLARFTKPPVETKRQ